MLQKEFKLNTFSTGRLSEEQEGIELIDLGLKTGAGLFPDSKPKSEKTGDCYLASNLSASDKGVIVVGNGNQINLPSSSFSPSSTSGLGTHDTSSFSLLLKTRRNNFISLVKQEKFIDKSLLIQELIIDPAPLKLIVRPRWFGKTLGLSMIEYFFDDALEEKEREERVELFKKLNILKQEIKDDKSKINAKDNMGAYPVIFLDFRSVLQGSFVRARDEFRRIMANTYRAVRCKYEGKFNPIKVGEKIINDKAEVNDAELQSFLQTLTEELYDFCKKPIILLIDNYDFPILTAYTHTLPDERNKNEGYYGEMLNFIKLVFSSTIKDRGDVIFQAIFTSTLHLSHEEIFSGIALRTYGMLEEGCPFSKYFGFTAEEIQESLGLSSSEVKDSNFNLIEDWYGGYRLDTVLLFNSEVSNFMKQNSKRTEEWKCKPYRSRMPEDDLVQRGLTTISELKEKFCVLIRENCLNGTIDPNPTLFNLEKNSDAFLGFLVLSGYLSYCLPISDRHSGFKFCKMIVPNKDLYRFHVQQIITKEWLKDKDVLPFKNLQREIVKQKKTSAFGGPGFFTKESTSIEKPDEKTKKNTDNSKTDSCILA